MNPGESQNVGGRLLRGSVTAEVSRCGTFGKTRLPGKALILLVLFAFVIRLVYVVETSDVPFVHHRVGDAAGYHQWAQRIAEGDWLGSESFYQAPLYPYVLGLVFTIFHSDIWLIRILQSLWGALSVGLIASVTARLFGSPSGILAGVMLTFYAPAIFFDGIIQKASLGCFIVCVLLWILVWTMTSVRGYALTLLGITVGLLALTRENALIWAVFISFWLLITQNRDVVRGRFQTVSLYLIGLVFVLVPIGFRNQAVGGEWSLTTFQAGPNFYIGNHLGASGLYEPLVRGHETPLFEREDATLLAQQATGKTLTLREVSRYWLMRTFKDISADPISWLKLFMRKNLMVWNRYEVSDAESLYVYAQSSWVLWGLSRVWHFGVLVPPAVMGVMVTWHDRKRLWWLYGLVVTMAFSVSLFFVLARYRFVLVPLLIPFAACGCVSIWQRWRAGGDRRWVSWVTAAVAVAVVVNWSMHDERRLNAMATMNAGVAMTGLGDLEEALLYFESAVAGYPESAEVNNNLAQALALTGEYERAVEHYGRSLAAEPDLMGVDYNLGVALERLGRLEEALKHYERAVELDPGDVEAKQAVERLRNLGS